MWAVVGLGNPGRSYSQTRHNTGFFFIRQLAKAWNAKLRKKMYLSKAARVQRERSQVLLAMPHTYMNRSGLAVNRILREAGVQPEHLCIVYDDLDIPLGEIRIRKEGSAGTHKGMISIIKEIKTNRFPRIRIGIGPMTPDTEATDFVLSPFSRDEKRLLGESLQKGREALELILDGQIDKAMNAFNKKTRIN